MYVPIAAKWPKLGTLDGLNLPAETEKANWIKQFKYT